MCRIIDRTTLIHQRACCKVKVKRRCELLFKLYVNKFNHLQLQIPSSRTETLLKWSRHRDATVDHPACISKTSKFNCIDWWVQVSACSDFSGSYQELLTSLIITVGRLFEPVCSWIFVETKRIELPFQEPKSCVLTVRRRFNILFIKTFSIEQTKLISEKV